MLPTLAQLTKLEILRLSFNFFEGNVPFGYARLLKLVEFVIISRPAGLLINDPKKTLTCSTQKKSIFEHLDTYLYCFDYRIIGLPKIIYYKSLVVSLYYVRNVINKL